MRYRSLNDTLTFSNGVSVNQMEMERGGFGPLAQPIFKFSIDLHQMGLDDKELALLSVVCLLSSGKLFVCTVLVLLCPLSLVITCHFCHHRCTRISHKYPIAQTVY